MAEQTLNDPLSGAEIIEATLDKLRTKMVRDCFLNPNSSYDWFTADITIHLDMHDAGVHVKSGPHAATLTVGTKPVESTQVADVLEVDAAPPNEVRVSTGQPVPTLTKGEGGESVVKRVPYPRSAAAKFAKK